MKTTRVLSLLSACIAGLFIVSCSQSEKGTAGPSRIPVNLTSTASGIDLEYEAKNFELTPLDKGGMTFTRLKLPNSVDLDKKGFAAIPFATVTIQIPPDRDVHVDVVDADEFDEQALKNPLVPSRGTIYRNQNPDTIPYAISADSMTKDWYPGPIATQSEPFIMRDVRGINIHIYPFQYRSFDRTLRVYSKLKLRVTLVDTPAVNALPVSEDGKRLVSPTMDTVYKSLFLNYNSSAFVGEELKVGEFGEILVIHTSRDSKAIEPYIQWKKQKGFKVSTLEVAKGTNVKSAIAEAYSKNNNILYVQLVGDWEDIKSDLGPQSAPTDPALGCVAGNDHYPDLIVGRFAANSPAQVSIQIQKAISYEKDPLLNSDFYTTGLGIASGEGAGQGDDDESDYEHMGIIRINKLLTYTYKKVYEAYKNPTKASVVNAIDKGVGIINYVGHGSEKFWVTSGYGVNDVKVSKNGAQLPIIISVACVNGAFHSKSETFAEALLNQKDGGAVAALMSTINQPWTPPMRGQDYINDIIIQGYQYGGNNPGKGTNVNGGRTTFGSIVFNGLNLMYAESSSTSDLDTIQTWTLFGDASLEIRTATPKPITISVKDIPSQAPFSTVVNSKETKQLLAGVRVTITQGDRSFTGVTGVDGRVSLAHDFALGTAILAVTGYNLQPIYQQVDVY